ncbi:MAG: winged helix-turn-helix domain-containing protein, partial [Pseudomonadota bacterium]
MVYRFADFELDPPRRALHRCGAPVDLEPQVFDLLVMFVRSEGRAVTKDEIIDAVWQGRAISDAALTSRIKSLRQALGDGGRTQSMIRTLHRVGYQFV